MLTKEERLKNGTARAAIRLPAVLPMAENGIRFLLSAVLAGAELSGGGAMCGVAMVGAFGAGSGGTAALLGAVFGYLCFRGLPGALRYIAASVLVFSVSFAVGGAPLVRRRWFMPAVAAGLNGAVGFIYLSEGGWSPVRTAGFLTEVLLTGALAFLYRLAFSIWQDPRETPALSIPQAAGLMALVCSVLAALSRVSLLSTLSLGRVLAAALVVLAGWKRGMGAGAAVGVAAGLSMDLAAGSAPYYAALCAFSGLTAGVFQKQGRLFTAVAFATAGGAAALWTWGDGSRLGALYELLLGTGVFLLLPDKLLDRLEALSRPAAAEDGAARARAYAAERLAASAGAFRALAGELDALFHAPGPGDGGAGHILARAAARACAACPLRELCWTQQGPETRALLGQALPALLDRGRGRPEDYPEEFALRCVDLPGFSAAVNEEIAACLARRQYEAKVRQSRGAVCLQYGELAALLEDASAELAQELAVDMRRQRRVRQRLGALGLEGDCAAYLDENCRLRVEVAGPAARAMNTPEELQALSELMEVPLRVEEDSGGGRLKLAQSEPLMAVAGIAAKQKEGQTVSGDAGAWFKDGAGRLHIFLCDGMGSGPEAHADSAGAVGLLEKFLRAGVDPTQALVILNGALALRGEAEGGFTTIDLLRLDLFTGKGALYKFGAAPTYVRRGGQVRRLAGNSLPAGLDAGEAVRPDVIPLEVSSGDWIIMASDGVTAGEEDWISEAVAKWEGDSPRLLAQQLLEGCLRREAGQDDRTVVAVKVAWR